MEQRPQMIACKGVWSNALIDIDSAGTPSIRQDGEEIDALRHSRGVQGLGFRV
jgi:hypothetical protein